ncbi:hypothetical protein GCM10007989_08010 [Devosia pacifica]|uniref:Uncharacterized protein n=1 Tax=Devosia pacifica TaxID=1335967 RepID=A0A918VPY2_9HYPH|nr:hypothetical protein [Devosia pacifica]GHA15633.1 hypothetical protein GCM10007989_08010 [Devosia pacifica]
MDTKAAIFALLSVWGVGTCMALPASAQDIETETEAGDDGETSKNPLLNRVWVRADETGLPGPMHIFLQDGTLVSDSCWETYRLSEWQQVSTSRISWDEDGMKIDADIASLNEGELVLRLHRIGGSVEEQRFTAANVPYVCPDIET